jgi:hypothetical protein
VIPEPRELPEPVVSWFDGMAGERGVERVDPAFEFLYPAFDPISDAVDENFMTDTERPSALSFTHKSGPF